MTLRADAPSHVVAIFGGACAGSVAAQMLAERGVQVVVFEQNARPYGKVEDGLPRWHTQQRLMEYRRIDARLDREGITYVPLTALGRDLDFRDVVGWGWSAVLLANGAWKDRPLEVPNADVYVGRGLVYQNPFVYWFNHKNEAGYAGPAYHVPDGALCVGGGLASIDVVKILQLEAYQRALHDRGIDVSMHELEHQGIPATCAAKGTTPEALGLDDCLLIYRRRVEDMPLASPPPGATDDQRRKTEAVRRKILLKAQEKYRFRVRPLTVPKELVVENERVVGLVALATRVDRHGATPLPGSDFELRTPLIVSSIGSLPEPIPGIEMSGSLYACADRDTGAYAPIPGVFGVGNVVTGKGNIVASVSHGKRVATHLLEHYLGVGAPDERDVSEGLFPSAESGRRAAAAGGGLTKVRPLPPERIRTLGERVRRRQEDVGYHGRYREWLQDVTPPDLE